MKVAEFPVGLMAFITCISHSAYSTVPVTKNKLYAGVFTGISSSNKISTSQYGTLFIPEGRGDPLAVNAFGQLDRKNAAFIGAQIGYQWPSITTLNGIAPAIEL